VIGFRPNSGKTWPNNKPSCLASKGPKCPFSCSARLLVNRLVVVFGEIFSDAGSSGSHGLFPFRPVGRADVAVLFMEL